MKRIEVQIPAKGPAYTVQLLFMHEYANGNGAYDYIQMIRSRAIFAHGEPSRLERQYWDRLEEGRRQFAHAVRKEIGDVDMIVDPPSQNTLHRPYLAAVLDEYARVPWLYFLKEKSVQSLFGNLAEMRDAIKAPRQGDRDFTKKKNEIASVLIVDDAYSEGNVASVVIEKLIEFGIRKEAQFFIVAPLRVHG